MIVTGEFTLKQDGKVVRKCQNHLTKDAAIFMLSVLNSSSTTTIYYPSNASYMTLRAGKDAYTPSFDVTALKDQVVSIPAAQITTSSVYTDDTFEFKVLGLFTQQNMALFGENKMTELGFFSSAPIITTYNWTANSPTSQTIKLLGYISAPTDFNDTDVDVTKALTAEWKLKFTFGG